MMELDDTITFSIVQERQKQSLWMEHGELLIALYRNQLKALEMNLVSPKEQFDAIRQTIEYTAAKKALTDFIKNLQKKV